jgi:hypothetical protein
MCRGDGRDFDQPDAAGVGGGWLNTPCPKCAGTGKVDELQTFANSVLNGILTISEKNEYVLSRPLTRGEMLHALHYCQDGYASCLFTLNLFEAHQEVCDVYRREQTQS